MREVHHTRNEAFRIAAPGLTTCNRATPISANCAVVAPHFERAAGGKDVLECISAIGANLQHTTVKAQIRVHIRCFKIKVVPECQLRDVPLENSDIYRIEPFVTDYRRIINERGVRWCISRRHRYSRIRCDPQRRWTLCIYRYPVWGQCGRRHPVEVFGDDDRVADRRRTRRRARCNRSKGIDPPPSSDIVRRACRPALLVRDKMCRFIQRCAAARNVVTQLWLGTPQQRHGTSDMRGGHGCTAKTHVSVIGRVIAGASACAWCRDIRFDPITSIDYDRPATAKVSNNVLARIQGSHRVRCSVDCRRIHYRRTIGTVIPSTRHHHDPGSSLSFDSGLQCVRRTTFGRRTNPGVTRNIRSSQWIALSATYRVRC